MSFPYKLKHANDTYTLDKTLDEISGIHITKNNHLLCIHDENLDIYKLHKDKIIKHFKSNEKGDIEDIVIINKNAYLLDAEHCMIYEYKNFKQGMKHRKKYDLQLNKNFDPEGLCYDKKNHCLLIACKGNPKKNSMLRHIFKFDLHQKKCSKKKAFTIDAKKLSGNSAKKTFNPSAIAIHPISGDIYLLSSKSLKMIVRFNKTGSKILGQQKLAKKQFPQPEGMSFSNSGELFIATEKKNKTAAKIFRFQPL